MMILLSQRNPSWAGVQIGQSQETVGRSGCTLTDVAMLSDWYASMGIGRYRNPGWLARNLSYTKDGFLYWSSVGDKLGFKFTWRFYSYDESKILPALSGKTTACMLRLYDGAKAHWVIGIRKIGNYYLVADPFPLPSGKRTLVHKNVISGGATFDKK